MSNNEWVQEGTPRDDAEWTEEADDYGVPVEPAEWDDYSDEQAMPVPPRPVQPEQVTEAPAVDNATQLTAPEADDPIAGEDEPVFDDAPSPVGEPTFDPAPESEPTFDGEPALADEPTFDDEPTVVPEPEAAAQASVFDDDQPVEAADEDVTREVAEGIEAERHDEAGDRAEAMADEVVLADEEYVVEDELAAGEPVEPALTEQDLIEQELAEDELAREELADDVVTDDVVADDVLADAVVLDDELGDGGSTRVDPDELEETALVDQIDDDATTVRPAEPFGRPVDADPIVPVAAAGAGAAGAALAGGLVGPTTTTAAAPAAMAGLYRAEADETQVLDTAAERRSIEQEAAEEEARAAALRAEKEERDRRLGMVQTSNANAERELRPQRRGVGPFGSFGLFVLRLITAAILGIVAYQVLYSVDATSQFLSQHPLIPEPRLVTWILGFTLAALAVMLVIGLGVRIAGLLLAVIAGLSLAFIRWGNFSPFVDGMEGFIGDKDLLLAAVGVLFFSIGGGRFGIDGAISRSRAEAREAKRA